MIDHLPAQHGGSYRADVELATYFMSISARDFRWWPGLLLRQP